MSKKQFSVRLDEEVYNQLNDYRWENRMQLNDVVNTAVKRFLNEEAKEVEANRK